MRQWRLADLARISHAGIAVRVGCCLGFVVERLRTSEPAAGRGGHNLVLILALVPVLALVTFLILIGVQGEGRAYTGCCSGGGWPDSAREKARVGGAAVVGLCSAVVRGNEGGSWRWRRRQRDRTRPA